MKAYFQHIVLLLKRLILALLLFILARAFFLFYNSDVFPDLGFAQGLRLFVVGLRFDISVIVYFNLLFIVMHLLPLGKIKSTSGYQGFLKVYFLIINGLLLFVNLADSVYFNFILRRSTADVLKLILISDDVANLLPSFVITYWYLIVLMVVLLIIVAIVYPKFSINKQEENNHNSNLKPLNIGLRFGFFFLFMGIFLIGARGGLQPYPLAIMHASNYTSSKYVPIVLNTPFAIYTTYGHGLLGRINYFSDKEAQELYPIAHQYAYENRIFQKKNVVIILWESYSREYSGFLNNYKGYTPFMDSLMQQSLVFSNAFSNGMRSIDAIPAVISGLPILMDDPFITSAYSTNTIESLAKILNQESYHTAFFHGGNNGTMGFNEFSKYTGFQEYYGLKEYDNMDDYDGNWGIFDEPFLMYLEKKLDSFNEPFFAFEFTLSSHNPYTVPKHLETRFEEGELEIHKVISYTDFALKKFFETASKKHWYNNTLFVILADHTAPYYTPIDSQSNKGELPSKKLQQFYRNSIGRFSIPIVFFSPGDSSLRGIDSTTIQQTDIMPTILDYLGYQKPFVCFGNSAFSIDGKHYAFEYANKLYQITNGDYSLYFNGEKSTALYNNTLDPSHKVNLILDFKEKTANMELDLRAILQQYHNGFINNQISISRINRTDF